VTRRTRQRQAGGQEGRGGRNSLPCPSRIEWRIQPTVMLAVLLLLTGCQYDPYAHTYTTEKPEASDLAGTYNLTEQTVTPGGLAALKGEPCRIELQKDGTFAAVNVPLNAEGTWRIDRIGSIGDGSGQTKTHWGVLLESDAARIEPVGLTGEGSPHGLIITIGGPDSGRVMIFKKAG